MNVTVTGASGNLGRFVCKIIRGAGYNLLATDKIRAATSPQAFEVMDLLDEGTCHRLVAEADAVVHLANHPDLVPGEEAKLFTENVAMDMNLFQAALRSKVSQIIFASSIQVLGGHGLSCNEPGDTVPYLPLDGDAPANPGNAYALSKHVGESLLDYVSRQSQICCVAIRFPWLVEPAAHSFHGKAHPRANHLDRVFSYLSYADAASLILAILRKPLPGFRIYLPAHPIVRPESPSELIREYYPTVPLRRPLAKIKSLIDISHIQNETGWSPSASFGRQKLE